MPQPSWRRPVTLIALLGLLAAGCGRADRFNVQNARAHVERLTASGSRWTGTPANEKARAYLIETLQLYGYDVRVQETDAEWREAGVTTRVANLIAIKPGQQREAIGLVSHYDSVAWGPGAGDDALGTAVVLEAARVLGARTSPRYSLMLLITDGEEHGLMGARALMQDPEVRARLKTFINLEAIGTDGPFVLFETGPGTSPALRAWGASSRPRGGSYMQSIYDALPNDTDFSVLKTMPGVSGINFAAAGDGYTYHTDRDRADRVTTRVLAQAGHVVLDVVDGLETRPSLDADPSPAMYVSLLDRVAFVWSLRNGVVAGWLVVVLGVASWLVMVRRLLRTTGLGRVLTTVAWAVIAAGAVLGALVVGVWLVRTGRAELHPWFAAPWRLFAFMTVMVVTVSWLVRRIAAIVPPGLKPDGTPVGVWFAALPVWIALLVLALLYAPAASYTVSLPLAAVVLLVMPSLLFTGTAGSTSTIASPARSESGPYPKQATLRTWPMRVASAGVVLLTWVLWVPDLVALLPFVVTLLGRLPIVTPTWVYPAVFFFAGILLWPPVLAVLVGRGRWRLGHGIAAGTLMFALVGTGLFAWAAAAYTAERPQQRSVLFLEDRVRGTAHWDLSSNEPGVDIGAGAPANVAWQPATGTGTFTELHPKAHLFRGVVPMPATDAPVRVTASVIRRPGDADIEVTITPLSTEWSTVGIVLPESIVPTRSTLVGRTRGGRWQAWHTSVPAEGLIWRATVSASQADRLAATEVWVSRLTVPEAEPGTRLPRWLQTPNTTWMTQHVVMLPIAVNESQEAPAPLSPMTTMPLPSATPSTAVPLTPAATPGTQPPSGGGVPR
jgi:hypothetical protein